MKMLTKYIMYFINFISMFLNYKVLHKYTIRRRRMVGAQIQKMFHLQKSVKVEFPRNEKITEHGI